MVVRAGFVEHRGVWRVQGELAVTRSIGDIPLQHYLSSSPDVVVLPMWSSARLSRAAPRSARAGSVATGAPRDAGAATSVKASADFVILGTDGLWDVMSNDEAVQLVKHVRATSQRCPAPPGCGVTASSPSNDLTSKQDCQNANVEGGADHAGIHAGRLAHDKGQSGEGHRHGSGHKVGAAQGGWESAAAQRLAWEAFVRGSSDNVGVYVVDLSTLVLPQP